MEVRVLSGASRKPCKPAISDSAVADFASALTHAAAVGEIEGSSVAPRAYLLASTLMGVWLTVRIDPLDAAALCGTVAEEIAQWRL